jgi:catechol 2,3-dioxygenase-like lactoylglutathione lyase family enzyme
VISHISLGVRNLACSGAFYEHILAALGYVKVFEKGYAIGFGEPGGKDQLTLFSQEEAISIPGPGFHLAFSAARRKAVDAFYFAALEAGGVCDGAPGLRLRYRPRYYAAFVRDPDGYKLEAHHEYA